MNPLGGKVKGEGILGNLIKITSVIMVSMRMVITILTLIFRDMFSKCTLANSIHA